MKQIKNIGDFTIQVRLYGRLIEIPVNSHITEEDFTMFDAQGRDEILRFLAIKLLNEKYKIEPKGFDEPIICPCCGKEFELKIEKKEPESVKEAKSKRGRPKKK